MQNILVEKVVLCLFGAELMTNVFKSDFLRTIEAKMNIRTRHKYIWPWITVNFTGAKDIKLFHFPCILWSEKMISLLERKKVTCFTCYSVERKISETQGYWWLSLSHVVLSGNPAMALFYSMKAVLSFLKEANCWADIDKRSGSLCLACPFKFSGALMVPTYRAWVCPR